MIGTSPTHVPLTAESAAKQLVADTTSETPQQTVSQITECHFATLDLACFFAYATLPSPPPTQVTLRYIVSPHLNALFTFTTTSHVHAVPNTRKVPIQTALEVVRAMARSRQLHIDTNGARFASTLFVVKLDRGEDGTLAIPLAASTYTCYDTLTAFDAEEYAIVLFPEFCGGPARNPYKMPAKACQTAESSTSATTPPPPPPAPKTTASSTASTGTTPPLPLTKADLAKQFQQRMDDKIVPPEVLDTFNEELEKLNSTDNYESNKARAYLKYITRLPWTPKKPTGRELNPPKLKDIANHLNSGHYGIDDAKSRILEFMAMSKLSNQPQGKVLCLAGSPGVGKTSLAASIASALNRSFARIALPSISTAADLVGHSRAWSSARPGCIATILAQLGEADPVILLDEVDKLSTGTQNGDVNGTLLAMLDPEQNHEFMDLYVGAPIDLSRVLFVATANAVTKMDATLLDRMEVLELPDYGVEEKTRIGMQYLLPRALETVGVLSATDPAANLPMNAAPVVDFGAEAMVSVVNWHCCDGGVRDLKRALDKIVRKIAYELVVLRETEEDAGDGVDAAPRFEVREDDLATYLGPSLDVCSVCREANSNYVAGGCRHEMCLTCWRKTLAGPGQSGPCPFCRKTTKLDALRKKN